MAPSREWEEELSDASTSPPSSPPVTAVRRRQFDDEEDDSDVLDSWDAAEDSEVEREKTRKAEEAKAKLAAEALANKKSKKERITEHIAERQRLADESSSDEEEETEAEKRARLRNTEKEADLHHAEALFGDFGDAGLSAGKGHKATFGAAVAVDTKDPSKTVNVGTLPLFNPQTKMQFENLRNTLVPILNNNSKKAHYSLFLQEFCKQLAKELPSDQIKKISSSLTALSNEKMKEEKTVKGGKKSKAAKTKTSLVASRSVAVADTYSYDNDAFGDDDFM